MTISYLSDGGLMVLKAGAWISAGALIGALYFMTLRHNVTLLATARAPLFAMALQFGRFAALAGILAVIASRFGALPLLLATAGIVAARMAAVRLGALT